MGKLLHNVTEVWKAAQTNCECNVIFIPIKEAYAFSVEYHQAGFLMDKDGGRKFNGCKVYYYSGDEILVGYVQ